MPRRPVLAFLLFALPLVSQASSPKTEMKFRSGGHIRMELSAGDAEIVGGKGENIVITFTADQPSQVKADVKTDEGIAVIKVSGPRNNFHYRIEVPEHSTLYVRMSAGALEVDGVRGAKDIELRAGDLTINIGDPRDYGRVDASVTMGGLEAPAFGESKGGMWRSFKFQGDGSYPLHAHVFTGGLTLR